MQTSHNQLFTSSQQEFLNSFISSFLINGTRSKFSEYLQFIFSEIQFLAILIGMHTTFLGLGDQTNEFSFLHNISQSIATITQNNIENSLISVLSKILWLYFLFALILIGNVTFKAFKLQKLNPQFQTLLSSVFQFHSGFLFWVFNMIFMTEISSMSLYSQNQAVLSIDLVLLILNYAFGLLGALFCFDPFCSSNLFASRRSIFQTFSFLFKAFLAPLAVFTDSTNTDAQVFFVIFALFVSILRVFGLLTYFAFYYYKPMRLALIFTAIGLWISIVNVISIIIQKSNGTTALNSSFYLILVPLPIVVKAVLAKLQNIMNFYIIMDPKSLQTKPQVYKKLFAYRYMSEHITLSLNENKLPSRYELYFIGKLRDHAKTCGDSQCLCHNFLNTKDPGINSTKNLLSKYCSLAASSLLSEAVNKFRKNTDLKIALADLIFTRAAQGLTAALVFMFSTPQENVGFFMKIKKHILRGKIQERLVEYFTGNDKSKLNIVNFVDYQAESGNFLSKMTKVINEYLEFWETYQKPKLKMSEIMDKSIAIEKGADELDGLWNSCIEKYEAFYHQMKNQYKLFLSLVRNMPHAGNQIIRKFKWKKKLREPDFTSFQLTQDDLNSSQTLTVHISMARERLGRVTNVSENIQGPTGYTSRDLIGENISFLMPSCLAEKHEELLLRRLNMLKGVSQMEESSAEEVYIKTKAGHIVQCSSYATLFPYIQHELIYIVIIKVMASKYDHILVDSLGYIDGYTENIGKKLGLVLENKTHIKEICPDIYQAYPDFQMSNTKEENNVIETTPNSVSLEFIQRGSPANQYKYMSTLTKKTIFNKSVYIFQLEPSYEAKQDQRTSKNYVDKSSQSEDSAIDIPLERILSTDIPLIPDLRNPRLNDSLHKTGFVFKTLDTQGDVIPLTGITTVRSPTFSHSNEKNNTKRDFNLDLTASNRAFLENKVSGPLPMLGKKLERIFSEGGRSTASAAETVSSKLEKSIYSLPRDKSISLFKVSAWALIMLAIGLLVIILINTKTNLKYVKQNTSVITTSTLRLFQITELNRRARAISLYGSGLIDDQRYVKQGYRYPLLPLFSLYIGMIEPELNKYNNLVREAIEQIDATLQKELFANLIPIIDPDLKTVSDYTNVFEATTRLVVEAQALAEVPFYELQNGTSQVNYILNNTLNDQIIVGEKIINVLISDNELKLKTVKNQSIYFIIITSLLGFIANAFFTSKQLKFIKNRNRFIEIFLRLDQQEIEQNMNNVKAFKHSLLNNSIELEESHSNHHLKDPRANRSFAKGYNVRARTANMKGIDCRLFIAQILSLCIFILIVAPFLSIDILLKSETSIINNGVNNIVLVNQNLFETTLLGAAIGEYIQYNGTTTMRNRPIGEEYEATLARLSASQTVFTDLLNSHTNNKTERDQLDYLLTGNLCVGLGIQATSCSVVAKFLEKGIIEMNSFMLLTLKRLKDMFDMSDRSFTSAKNTLVFIDLIYMEYLYAISQLPVYQTLGGLLEDDVDTHINGVADAVLTIIIVSVVIGVVLGYLCSRWLWKIVETEKVNWKKLGRKIPFSMAVSDKAFKNYLVRESDHLLNSVKVRI